jgi:hypothetical protein
MVSTGSTLFTLTWNDVITPSGRRICALRASARRTRDSGCTSWPTPTVSRGDYNYAHGDHETPTLKLAGAAKTAAWPTPLANAAAQEAGGSPEQFLARKAKAKGAERGVSLTSLSMQAQLADAGTLPTGSSAEIPPADRPSLGQLNPEHSRWLQGYPAAWGYCGAMVMRSRRK